MKRSTLQRIAAIVSGIVLMAIVILGVAAISAPKTKTGLPKIQLSDASGASAGGGTGTSGQTTATGSTGSTGSAGSGKTAPGQITDSSAGSSSGGSSGVSGKSSGKSAPTVAPGASGDTDTAATGPIGDMLPASVQGFTLVGKQVGAKEAAVFAEPVSTSSGMSRATLTVYDRDTATDADAFVKRVSSIVYPRDVSLPAMFRTVAYAGTDGRLLATVEFSRGRYVYEVVGTSLVGKPAALNAQLVALAKGFRPPGVSK
jgi:hypothetical protein